MTSVVDQSNSYPRMTTTTTTTETETVVVSSSKGGKTQPQSSSSPSSWFMMMRLLLVDIPMMILFCTLAILLIIRRSYWNYVIPITKSYERGESIGNFYKDYDNDFTYYNRHCGPDDVSTKSSNDLLIHEHYTETEAANLMLQHGVVAIQNVLQNDTATELRNYLSQKHLQKSSLSYNEIMWDEISRLSLGIGTNDHPVIADAMEQVGNHPVVKKTLEGILGPDPAILEISTLTSLNGADDQGIHTDSDWFGSSLLYSRNFLHSYSMFIALQDTSKDLGATTVCPGSHYCADIDLEEMCLDAGGAFEVSTNGHTGPEHGLFRKGDAFLFNQNIWHRGPKNVDPDGLDRFMFIMTFATSSKSKSTTAHAAASATTTQDRRRQGLGTYYYQRFNMWGSTYSMLQDAKRKMVQPLAGLRALGFIKTNGITWIHQFCQQFANGDEFYNDGELEELHSKVFDYYGIPTFLKSQSEKWDEFIPETMDLWIDFLTFVIGVVMTIYCIVYGLIRVVLGVVGSSGGNKGRRPWWNDGLVQFIRRPTLIAASIALVTIGINAFIDRTDLAQSVISGDVFVKPFPTPTTELQKQAMMLPVAATTTTGEPTTTPPPLGPTTLPERHDVLISTRFDADFLASFNRFLDFHPGNRRWNDMVSSLTERATLPNHLQQAAARTIVQDVLNYKEAGLPSRFLLQDPFSGSWTIMSTMEAVRETNRAILRESNPLIGALATRVKYMLADSRFGGNRGTLMARVSERLLSSRWMLMLHGETLSTIQSSATRTTNEQSRGAFVIRQFFPLVVSFSNQKKGPTVPLKGRQATSFLSSKREFAEPDGDDDDDDTVGIGDKAWVFHENGRQWYEGLLTEFVDDEDDTCVVYFYDSGTYELVHCDNIRPYRLWKAGDKVVIDYYGNFEEFYPARITKVHPDGRCSVTFDDGEVKDNIGREQIVPFGADYDNR